LSLKPAVFIIDWALDGVKSRPFYYTSTRRVIVPYCSEVRFSCLRRPESSRDVALNFPYAMSKTVASYVDSARENPRFWRIPVAARS
jgi:hypothetical protein